MGAPANIYAALDFLSDALALVPLSEGDERYNAVPVQTGDRVDRVFLASSERGQVVALLKLEEEELASFHISSVIKASRCLLRSEPGGLLERYLRISCEDPTLQTAFRKFLEDIRLRLELRDKSVKSAVNEVANEWRQLIAVVKEPLSFNQLLGIFGELVILEKITEIHGPEALDWWYGPDRTRHDFVAPMAHLEVKSTIDLGSHRVTIHGLDQMDHAIGTSSFVGLVGVDPSPGGRCVDDVVARLRRLGCIGQSLDRKLLAAGYVEGNENNCSHRFHVAHVKWWEFDENSPGLRASNMRHTQQAGVSEVQFRFDLTALGEPLSADAADDMLSSLRGVSGK